MDAALMGLVGTGFGWLLSELSRRMGNRDAIQVATQIRRAEQLEKVSTEGLTFCKRLLDAVGSFILSYESKFYGDRDTEVDTDLSALIDLLGQFDKWQVENLSRIIVVSERANQLCKEFVGTLVPHLTNTQANEWSEEDLRAIANSQKLLLALMDEFISPALWDVSGIEKRLRPRWWLRSAKQTAVLTGEETKLLSDQLNDLREP